MKKVFLYLITAIALMISSPMAMACGSCHVDGAAGYQVIAAVDVGKAYDTGVTSVNASGIVTAKLDYIQGGGLFAPVIAYEKPRIRVITQKPNNDVKLYNAVLKTAYPGRYPYSGVTTA